MYILFKFISGPMYIADHSLDVTPTAMANPLTWHDSKCL